MTLDTKIRPLHAVGFVAIVAVAAAALTIATPPAPSAIGPAADPLSRFARNLFRVALVGVVLLTVVLPWLQSLHTRRRAEQPPAPPAPSSHTASGRVRRVDLYVIAAVLLGGLLWHASANRYTVTHYQLGSRSVVYQRTDTWTGHAELWVLGDRSTPRPAWVSLTSQK